MAAADGLPELVTPYNTSEFEALVAAVMTHCNAMRGQAEVVGADLGRELPHAKNVSGRMPFGMDLKIAAMQIKRQWIQVGAGLTSASAAASRSLQIFHGSFAGSNAAGGGRRFDAGR